MAHGTLAALLLFVSFGAFSWPTFCRAAPFTFNDIQFWVGSGPNRAAIVIDWMENATQPPALVWGYRWDGTARGRDMLAAVVAADPRLFAKLGGTRSAPTAVYGLGYDANGNGIFAIDDDTAFDDEGFAFSGPSDLAEATDFGDYYAEGWYTAFWHYGVASANPYDGGTWSDTFVGMGGRVLSDGAWDSWVFSPSFNFASFAENPQAAPPPTSLSGDFNRDGRIDAQDYDIWRGAFGATSPPAADANGNGMIDAADYVLWRANATSRLSPQSSEASNVPESKPIALLLIVFVLSQLTSNSRLATRSAATLIHTKAANWK